MIVGVHISNEIHDLPAKLAALDSASWAQARPNGSPRIRPGCEHYRTMLGDMVVAYLTADHSI